MKKNKIVLVPLATALASLSVAPAKATTQPARSAEPANTQANIEVTKSTEPNATYNIGDELFGMLVTTAADGTVVAGHSSHVSHGSHGSHTSHTSSRF